MSKNEKNNLSDKIQINWYPGHMAKTKREISEKLNLIDIVYEVIDARMPLSSKIVDIDNLIKNQLLEEDESSYYINEDKLYISNKILISFIKE